MEKLFNGIFAFFVISISCGALGMEPSEKNSSSLNKLFKLLSLTPSNRDKKKKNPESKQATSANSSVQNTPKQSSRFSEKTVQESGVLAKSESDPVQSPSKPRLIQFFSQGANGMHNFQLKLIFDSFEIGKPDLAEKQMMRNKITPEHIFEEALRKVNYKVAACVIQCKDAKLEEMLIRLIDELKPGNKQHSIAQQEREILRDEAPEEKKNEIDKLSVKIDDLESKQKPIRALIRNILASDRGNLELKKALKKAKKNNMGDVVRAIEVVNVGKKMKEIADANIERLESDSDFRELWGSMVGVKMESEKNNNYQENSAFSKLPKSNTAESLDSHYAKMKNKKLNKSDQAS